MPLMMMSVVFINPSNASAGVENVTAGAGRDWDLRRLLRPLG